MKPDTLKQQVLAEVIAVTGRKLKAKDILDWTTSEEVARRFLHENEQMVHCPKRGVWAIIPK
jgi:hypothetical protein